MATTVFSVNTTHARTPSAAAAFQKGIYHLFILSKRIDSDAFAIALRTYQALFQLCLTQYLLDLSRNLKASDFRKELLAGCADKLAPTANEVDPSVGVNHSKFEDKSGGWKGHAKGTPLHHCSKESLSLIYRTTSARHELVYRPQLLFKENYYWDDCSMESLLSAMPAYDEVTSAYESFIKAVLGQQEREIARRDAFFANGKVSESDFVDDNVKHGEYWADFFVQLIFWVYAEAKHARPTETLLLTYARMLNPEDEELLDEVRIFRNNILRLEVIKERLHFQAEWRLGEV